MKTRIFLVRIFVCARRFLCLTINLRPSNSRRILHTINNNLLLMQSTLQLKSLNTGDNSLSLLLLLRYFLTDYGTVHYELELYDDVFYCQATQQQICLFTFPYRKHMFRTEKKDKPAVASRGRKTHLHGSITAYHALVYSEYYDGEQ